MPERGSSSFDWVDIAAKFPATLSKDKAPELLADGETPDSYGQGLEKPGFLYVESSPSTGTLWSEETLQVTAPTNTPLGASASWGFWFNRLWGWETTGNSLTYGAYGYDTNYILDGLGYIPCDVESSNIRYLAPFGNNVAVFKAANLYLIRNADNPGNNFVAEYVGQISGFPASLTTNKLPIDNVLYWINTEGVFAYDGQKVTEITLPIRNNLGPFVSTTSSLYADFFKKRIIGGTGSATKFIIDTGANMGLYDYSTTGFRFTSRTVMAAEGEPLLIDKIALIYQYSAGDRASVSLDIKINDTWKEETTKAVYPNPDNGRIEIPLENILACRKFALRIRDMSNSFYISRIQVHVKTGGILGYSNK